MIVIIVIAQLGGLPTFVKIFGFNFLPSNEWTSMTTIPGVLIGLVSAALFTWIYKVAMPRLPGSAAKKKVGLFLVPVLGFFIGKSVIVMTAPMIVASVAGHDAGLVFVVADAKDYGDRKCRSPIKLQGLPFMFDTLCGFPNEFRDTLSPGQSIVVVGHGNNVGIYATGITEDKWTKPTNE